MEPTQPSMLFASQSPRRRQLLALTGWEATWKPVPFDESRVRAASVEDVPILLAKGKAEAARELGASELILAADTVVIDNSDILGKPESAEEAFTMLGRLRGRTHRVRTAVAVLDERNGETHLDACETIVPMRAYDDDEMMAYIRGGSPMDKAGAYGIQDHPFSPVDEERMQGCYANVMGLPLCHLTRIMKRIGFNAPSDVPASCQQATGYTCPVYRSILRGDV